MKFKTILSYLSVPAAWLSNNTLQSLHSISELSKDLSNLGTLVVVAVGVAGAFRTIVRWLKGAPPEKS
jgi:hypothetical protein